MMRRVLSLLLCLLLPLSAKATFSIVAIDPETGEIGSAGATCIDNFDLAPYISYIVPGRGAANFQAYGAPSFFTLTANRIAAGDTAAEVMQAVNNSDSNFQYRQRIIMTLHGNETEKAAFTGTVPLGYGGHASEIVGVNYVIAGNLLIGRHVLTTMETAFKQAVGDLTHKLMKSLQSAAAIAGADQRCLQRGTSSATAYLSVAQATDPLNTPSFSLKYQRISAGVDPITRVYDQYLGIRPDSDGDGVIDLFDAFPNDPNQSVPGLTVDDLSVSEGVGQVQLSLRLSAPARQAAVVTVTTEDISARAGSDYQALQATVVFAIGESLKTLSIDVLDDNEIEATEQFQVVLTNAVNLSPTAVSATLTLTDNDTPADLSACGEPQYDRASEAGVFLWKDCSSGLWSVRVTGGGAVSVLNYTGLVETPGGLVSYEPFSFEGNDILDNSADAERLNYSLFVAGAGQDGFSFEPVDETDSCFYATPPGVGIPLYLGEQRSLVESPLNLATLEVCESDPPSPFPACGEPVIDRTRDAGMFLWKDCFSGEWTARVSGGGQAAAAYTGSIKAELGFASYSYSSFESNDLLDNSSSEALIYTMTVGGSGMDSMKFKPIAEACFDVNPSRRELTLYLGEARWEILDAPLNLTTLDSCEPASYFPVCGEPEYDRASERGVFLWKDCAAGRWELRVTGGGSSVPLIYTGEVNSPGGFAGFSPFSFESNDVLENGGDPDLLSYILNVAGAGQDGFSFMPRDGTCIHSVAPDVPVYVGPERREFLGGSVNLDTLMGCP